jgi:DegV family protein with EDD domain
MSKIGVLTDSNSGITQDEGKKLGIRVIPMPFFINGEEYLEDINLTQEGFYEKLLGGASVSTSQPSIGYVNSIWDEMLTEYDSVIYIPMSSGLSKSCESALNSAKASYEGKVYVIDNQRISVTQRQSVLDTIEMINKGLDVETIVSKLMENKMHSDIFIMVDTLKYLKQGGRITPTAAALGGLIKIKPVLLIKGEKLDSFKMRNRTLENAKEIMIKAIRNCVEGYLKDLDGKTDNVHFGIAYTGTDRQFAEEFKEMVQKEFNTTDIAVYPLSLSVSCHIGPGALALAVSKAIEI